MTSSGGHELSELPSHAMCAVTRPGNPPPEVSTRRAWEIAAWLVVMLLGGIVRVLAARDDLWLDEVWTFGPDVLGKVRAVPDLFTKVHHENNHYLNTLLAWSVGPARPALVYRMPSILAGVASIGLSALIARRAGQFAGLAAALLTASSYLMVHYASEARGYALAVFFGLSFWETLNRLREGGHWVWLLLAGLSGMIGILAHPLTICVVAASLAANLLALEPLPGGTRLKLLLVHAAPAMVFLVLYMADLRNAERPGGPVDALPGVLAQTLSLALGGGMAGAWAWATAAGALLLHAACLLQLRRGDRLTARFCALAAWVIPLLVVLVEGRAEVYPRYFLVGVAILLVNLAQAAQRVWQSGRSGRRLCLGLLALYVLANGLHVARLVDDGRGRFEQVVAHILAHSDESTILVGGDHDFRLATMLNFAGRRLPPGRRIRYVAKGRWPAGGPAWLITHSFEPAPAAPRVIESGGLKYNLQGVYRYAGLSGWSSALYRRENAR